MPLDQPAVSIVMPCLDEALTIGPAVARARDALELLRARHGLTGEVVVADNGSRDGSQAIAIREGARVVAVAARGYGAALIGGLSAARGRYLVMGDSDGSYDFVESVPMVEALMEGAELCMGSRFRGTIRPGAMPWKNRYIGNPALTGILRLMFATPVSDAHCGLRALTRDCFESLRLTSTGMEFASEMVLKAGLLKKRIAEVPVTLSPDGRNRAPHLRPWRDGWRHLRYMMMLSPAWLFFVPAAMLGAGGLAIFAALLGQPDRAMVALGPLLIGDHWAVGAATMIGLSVQTAFFGLIALVYAYREGFRRPSPALRRVLCWMRLETCLIGGGLVALAGLAGASLVVADWAAEGFGSLSAMRELLAAFTAVGAGVQTVFSGFLMSIVAGNEASPAAVAETTAEAPDLAEKADAA